MEQAHKTNSRYLIPIVAILCLTPYVSSALALISGIIIAVVWGNPFLSRTKKLTSTLLSWSVVGLGAGMNLAVVGLVGVQGIGYTIIGIACTLTLGFLLGRWMHVDRNTSALVSVGTAICGGSAIAAVGPTIQAKSHEMSVALGIVFMLNALALFIFPLIGEHFQLTQHQFGLWAALAIHDTSSVVGASMHYGPEALEIGTTVKLARALWIVPVTLLFGFIFARGMKTQSTEKPKRPWFILGFLLMAAFVTWVPALQPTGQFINSIAKRVLVLTLFLIGTNLTKEALRQVGLKPLFQGVLLWIGAASVTLFAILQGWIH